MRIEKKQASSSLITVCHPVNSTILAISIRNIFILCYSFVILCKTKQNYQRLGKLIIKGCKLRFPHMCSCCKRLMNLNNKQKSKQHM